MPSAIPAALTSAGGVVAIAQMLTDNGFECLPNPRFTSCQSPSSLVRLAAWNAEDGAASEIDATFEPHAEPAEVAAVLSLLDVIAPGTRTATEAYRADTDARPRYETMGDVELRLIRDAGGVVSAVLRPA